MDARDLIKKHEGWRDHKYMCSAGHWTIGWGHLIREHEIFTGGISEEEGEELFEDDYQNALQLAMSFPFWNRLSEVRQAVLVDMAFNLGGRLLTFKKFLKALKERRYNDAAWEMLDSKWAKQVRRRAIELEYAMRFNEFKP